MPNHVTTIIDAPFEVIEAMVNHEPFPPSVREDYSRLDDEQFAEYAAELQSRNDARALSGYVDFARIIPQPDNIETGGCTGDHPPGVICWYEWNVEHWGTKWNAYETEIRSTTEVKFETAWAHPVPIIRALARRFPDATIEVKYADEDLGANLGHYRIVKGVPRVVDEFIESSEKANNFAAQIVYGKSYADICEEELS